jgi:predicted dehydrogenase
MPYRIALIGCGRVGVWLEDDPLREKPASHLGGIKKIIDEDLAAKGLEVTGLCDIDRERLLRCRERWSLYLKNARLYHDYRKLILKEKPDLIIIATWTFLHRDMAVFAARHGVKGIVLEKPLTISLKQAEDVIAACRDHHVKLVVNHERRWAPLYRKTREILESKCLGELKLIYGNVLSRSAPRGPWQSVLKEAGGGPLLHDGTHLVDMIRYFCGDIETVNGYVSREDPEAGVETTATALLRAKNSTAVFLEAGGLRDYFNFEMDLQFERGRIKIGNGIRKYYITADSRRYSGFRDLTPADFPPFSRDTDPFTGAILEVIHALETDGEPQSSVIDGWKAMEVIFAIYRSAALGGKTLNLPVKINRHPLMKMFARGML